MSEDEIRDHIQRIVQSVKDETPEIAVSSGTLLIGQLLIDIHRIAEAMNK